MGQTCGEVRCSRPNGKLVSVGRAAQAHKKLSDGRPHRSFTAVFSKTKEELFCFDQNKRRALLLLVQVITPSIL